MAISTRERRLSKTKQQGSLSISKKRVIVYATDDCLDELESATTAYFDGTFKVAPRHFCQIWVIRVKVGEVTIPVAYAILEDKSYQSYSLAIEMLKEAAPTWSPTLILTDFEQSELKALYEHFDKDSVRGCNFHYDQALLKHFKRVPGYATDSNLRDCLYLCFGLSFVPPCDVLCGWHSIRDRLRRDHSSVCEDFVTYFEDTWLNGLYSLKLWNCYERTLNGQPRTNNVSEGGNNSIRIAFGIENPVFWKFVEKLREFQTESDVEIVQSTTGRRRVIPRVRERVRREQKRVKYARDYSLVNMLEYLRKHSYLSAARQR